MIVSVRLILPDIAGKLWLPDLPCHHGKATSDREMIFISPQRNKGGNGDYCSHFSVTLETPGKFIIVFISLILGKIGIDGVNRVTAGNWHPRWIWFEGNFKGFKVNFQATIKFVVVSVKWVGGCNEPRQESDVR